MITDEQTAIAVSRAEEALRKAENDLEKHMGTSVPHTSDDDRKNAWNTYHNWKNIYYNVQDSKMEKERELAELNAKLGDSEELSEGEVKAIKDSIAKVEKEHISLTDELTYLERKTVDMPDYSAEESEYDAWQEKSPVWKM